MNEESILVGNFHAIGGEVGWDIVNILIVKLKGERNRVDKRNNSFERILKLPFRPTKLKEFA